ncbi:MAG: hypothetical protein LBE35_10885 [Clostridiales bacterium]|jgi:hypothetical protein|nr:hypothetical protein [Clostridiales bacterium]
MSSKFQNRIKRILYRPIRRKRPHRDFISKKLEEAEKALNSTVGGIFGRRRR